MVEETLVSKYGNSASILGFISLPDDQENLHKLYAQNSTVFVEGDATLNLRRREYAILNDDNNEVDGEGEFIKHLQHMAKIEDEEMTRMYQHLTRVLRSFGDDNDQSDDDNDNKDELTCHNLNYSENSEVDLEGWDQSL